IELPFEAAGQRYDRVRIAEGSTSLLHRRREPLGVLVDQFGELLPRWIERQGLVDLTCKGGRVLLHVIANLVGLLDHALDVTRHAGNAVEDGSVSLLGVLDDLNGASIKPHSLGVYQEISLQSVGQIENDFTAVMLEAFLVISWAQGMLENIAPLAV